MQRELRLSRMGEELRDGAGAAHAVPLIAQASGVELERPAGVGILRDGEIRRSNESRTTVDGWIHAVPVEPRRAIARVLGKRPLLRPARVEQRVRQSRDV